MIQTVSETNGPSETDRLLPRPIDTEANKGSNSTFAIQASDVIANDYLHERAKAVQDIEANMTELVLIFLVFDFQGSIFERLSTMISEQGEMIDRLDDNLDAAEVNVNMGYQEIVKYGQNVYVTC